MAEAFIYNANDQYVDLRKVHESEDQNIDTFFDHAEEVIPIERQPTLYEEVVERESYEVSDPESDCFFSPLNGTGYDTATVFLKGRLRRSMSTDNLPKESPQNRNHVPESRDDHHAVPRASSACSMFPRSSRAPSQESINRLAQPKHYKSNDNLLKNEMTLAEAVRKFQAGTPKRFKTRPSPKINKLAPVSYGGTRAHSPKLMTTNRVRKVTAISKEEQETREMEEARKFRIRAHPVNQKILKGPLKPPVEKKPPTVAEPFKLTEIKKKVETEEIKVPSFKAQPIPKSLHNPLKVRRNSESTVRGPSLSLTKKKVEPPKKQEKPFKPTMTHIVPFSFDQRDKQMMKKKEEFINKILEDERKAREFHAKPPPKAILKSRTNSQDAITEPGFFKSSTEELDTTVFKARPATVLHTKPFEPKRDDNHVLKIEAFQLTTDQRIEARKKFDEKMKKKEALIIANKKQEEEMMRIMEEQEVARLRKQMEYKAQPIKKYKEVEIKSANKVTEPKSPKFHTNKLRNKENIQQ